MLIWIIILIILLLLSNIKYNTITYWGSVLGLILIAGFRASTVGTDTISYEQGFNRLAAGYDTYLEKGWKLLEELVIYFGGDYHIFLLVVSILTIGSISIVFKKYSENPQLSLFIYYAMYAYLNSFNAMRQFIAVSFIIVAYAELRNKRIFLFIISVFVASFIHTSALIALIVLFAPFIKTDNSLLIYTTLFITLLMGSFVNDSFFRIVSQGYFHYIEDGTFGYREQESTISALIMCILMNILFIVIYKSTDILVKKDMFFIIFFMAIIIMNITYRLELGTRIILYFTTIQTLLYPKFFNKNYVYLKWIILCYLLVVFFKILILGGGGVKNYESVILNYI